MIFRDWLMISHIIEFSYGKKKKQKINQTIRRLSFAPILLQKIPFIDK